MARRKISRSSPLLGALAHATVAASAALPWPAAQRAGRLLGHLSRVLPNPFRTVSRRNIAWCFAERDAAWRRRLLRESLLQSGMTVAETGPLLRWAPRRLEPRIADVDGAEALERARAGGRGTLLLVPHLGNWELLNPYLAAGERFVALYRPARVIEFERTLVAARERTGCTMIPATPAGLKRLYRALAAGRLALVLPDQEPVRRSGVFAPFFGVPALTMTLVGRILRRLEVAALFGFTERRPDGRLDLFFSDAPADLADPDPRTAAEALNREIERRVRPRPEQYFWSYKRFKSRPPEEERALVTPGDETLVTLYERPGPEATNPRVRLR